ncbi:hypothetical protein Salat_1853500 [Sesamum alatum]|uniref:Uncharacterized protein n=1 Tax=Sesamum alatum TaxID=300844 RepID=A0AAE1Y2U5_9LAMI|nr:hypothetical protein Salat_1853500 [Sesamum alatum]
MPSDFLVKVSSALRANFSPFLSHETDELLGHISPAVASKRWRRSINSGRDRVNHRFNTLVLLKRLAMEGRQSTRRPTPSNASVDSKGSNYDSAKTPQSRAYNGSRVARYCCYGEVMELKTSWTTGNPGRRFRACSGANVRLV